jgi:hypothetical protein
MIAALPAIVMRTTPPFHAMYRWLPKVPIHRLLLFSNAKVMKNSMKYKRNPHFSLGDQCENAITGSVKTQLPIV